MQPESLISFNSATTLEQLHIWLLTLIVVGIVFYLAAKEDQTRS